MNADKRGLLLSAKTYLHLWHFSLRPSKTLSGNSAETQLAIAQETRDTHIVYLVSSKVTLWPPLAEIEQIRTGHTHPLAGGSSRQRAGISSLTGFAESPWTIWAPNSA
jgi:hypothetical protein